MMNANELSTDQNFQGNSEIEPPRRRRRKKKKHQTEHNTSGESVCSKYSAILLINDHSSPKHFL